MNRLDTVADYAILGALGKGGMGVVYVGYDAARNRFAALKVLSDQIAPDPVAVKRFQREGELYDRIRHPNVVESLGAGVYHGIHYIALEYVQGRVLNDVLAQGGGERPVMGPVEAFEIFRSLLSALQACHELGVVHRDLKPHNVIVNHFGVLKLLDFGVAQVSDDALNLTKTGLIVGTILYASPEQNQGKTVTHRSDLYSLGILLHEMLTGRRLFTGSNVGEIIIQQIQGGAIKLSERVPGLPAAVDEYFQKLINPMATSRWADARTAFAELDALVARLGPDGRRIFYGEPGDELWFGARIHFARNEYDKAAELARRALTAGRASDPRVHLMLGRIAREAGDEAASVASFRTVLQMAPADRASRLEYALALTAFDKRDLAVKELDALLKVVPDDVFVGGLRDLLSHKIRWMSREEVESRRKSLLDDMPLPASGAASAPLDAEPDDEEAYVRTVARGLRDEAARVDVAAVSSWALYFPGAGQLKMGLRREGGLFALLGVFCFALVTFVIVTGLDFHIPVYDALDTLGLNDRLAAAIESALEERVNAAFQTWRLWVAGSAVAGAVALLFHAWSVSLARAEKGARLAALVTQVKDVPVEERIILDIGGDRGVETGQAFEVVKLSRRGKLPIGRATVTKVGPSECEAAFVLRRPRASGEELVDSRAGLPEARPATGERLPPPAPGDVCFPL